MMRLLIQRSLSFRNSSSNFSTGTEYEEEIEQEERKRLCKEAAAACLEEIHKHCIAYINQHNEDGSYEGWIREFHPENSDRLCHGMRVDYRFYARDSDHRIIWNSYSNMQGRQEWKIVKFLAPEAPQ